jgi:phage repressor protein C with HTH and peptisase S24 domain
MKKNIAARLKKIESSLGLNPSKMAAAGGCSRSTYYRYRNGGSTPTVEFLDKILKYENKINAEWLLKGNGQLLKDDDHGKENRQKALQAGTNEKFYHFPLYRMYSLNGEQDKVTVKEWDNTTKYISISKDFLNLFLDSDNYQDAFTMTVEGDSMIPDIKPGGIILVDTTQVVPVTDGIFVVRYDDFVRMKLVQTMPGHKLILSTLNTKFASVIVEKDYEGFEILGRIVCSTNPI